MIAVIIAGGAGTRMGKQGRQIPKALMRLAGKPLLKYQLDLLKRSGIKRVLILTNHLSYQIEEFCRHYRGLTIECIKEQEALGTAGAVKAVQKKLKGDFLVLYGDVLINMDLRKLINFHNQEKNKHRNLSATLVVHPNSHPFDSDLVEAGEDFIISNILPKPHPQNLYYRNLVNAGAYIFTQNIFKSIQAGRHLDFGRQVFPRIISQKKYALAAYNTPEYLKDMGTPKRLKEVAKDVKSGKFKNSSLKVKRPTIFLDRDGVINKEVGDLRRITDFVLLPGVAKAIAKINSSDYYAVVISNQPAIAKGYCSYEDVLSFHKKMETLLGQEGAKLDGVYFCPHHPDRGYPGENKKYKIHCSCRKPKIGLITRAAKDLNIDLKNSVFIGDTTRDQLTSQNARVKFVGVSTGYGCQDRQFQDKIKNSKLVLSSNLYSAVSLILKRNK